MITGVGDLLDLVGREFVVVRRPGDDGGDFDLARQGSGRRLEEVPRIARL